MMLPLVSPFFKAQMEDQPEQKESKAPETDLEALKALANLANSLDLMSINFPPAKKTADVVDQMMMRIANRMKSDH